MQKHRDLIDLVKLPNDVGICSHSLVYITADNVNKGVFSDRKRGPNQCTMLVNDNLLLGLWAHLKPALSCSAESLHVLLGKPDMKLRRSTLSVDKHY